MTVASVELVADSSQIRTATRDLNTMAQQAQRTETAAAGLNKGVAASTGSLSKLGRSAGQAGIQIQQFVGQVQGGQSALLALSQQGADLGFVLGAPLVGAVVGIGASIAGFLLPNLLNSKDASKELADSMEKLEEIARRASGGVFVLSDELDRLAQISQSAAISQINLGLIQAREAAQQAAQAIGDAFDIFEADFGFSNVTDFIDALSIDGFLQSTRSYEALAEVSRELGEEFGRSGAEAEKLGNEIIRTAAAAKQFPTPENLQRLNDVLSAASNGAERGTVAAQKFAGEMQAFFSQARTAAETTEFLNSQLVKLQGGQEITSERTRDASASVANLTTSLQAQIIALESGAQAAEVYSATQQAIANGTQEQLPTIIELINRKYELANAQRAAAEAARAQATEQKNLDSVLNQIAANTDRQAAAERARLEGAAGGNLGLTRLQALEQQYAREKQLLEEAQAAGIASEVSYQERLTELQRQYSDQRQQIQSQEQSASFQILSQGTSQSLGQFAGVLGGFASLAQQGGEEAFSTYKTLASAQAAIAGTLAVLSVLGDPIVPAFLKIPLATSIGVLAAAQIAQIQSQTYQGRALGGQVRGGQTYMVGERGPELFTPNSSGSGRVTPFNQLMNEARGNTTNTATSVVNINMADATGFQRPESRRQIEAAAYRGMLKAYRRNA